MFSAVLVPEVTHGTDTGAFAGLALPAHPIKRLTLTLGTLVSKHDPFLKRMQKYLNNTF